MIDQLEAATKMEIQIYISIFGFLTLSRVHTASSCLPTFQPTVVHAVLCRMYDVKTLSKAHTSLQWPKK